MCVRVPLTTLASSREHRVKKERERNGEQQGNRSEPWFDLIF